VGGGVRRIHMKQSSNVIVDDY
jgi:hypothetical protein